jgi:hypothetical protein
MTDWRIVRPGDEANPTLVEPERTYVLQPGDAHFYDVGVVHSPKREGLTKLVRIEGANPTLHPPHQRQGGTVHPNQFARAGLRPALCQFAGTQWCTNAVAPPLQSRFITPITLCR